jgi:hypothetical protein
MEKESQETPQERAQRYVDEWWNKINTPKPYRAQAACKPGWREGLAKLKGIKPDQDLTDIEHDPK